MEEEIEFVGPLEPEYEEPREVRLEKWVAETNAVNEALLEKGIQPNYTCSFVNGEFKEWRR